MGLYVESMYAHHGAHTCDYVWLWVTTRCVPGLLSVYPWVRMGTYASGKGITLPLESEISLARGCVRVSGGDSDMV